MWMKGDVLTYTGRNQIGNLVIQSLQSTHDATNRKGFTFTATLKQITIGSSEDSGTADMMSGQDNAAAIKSAASSPGGKIFLPNIQSFCRRSEDNGIPDYFEHRIFVLCGYLQLQAGK